MTKEGGPNICLSLTFLKPVNGHPRNNHEASKSRHGLSKRGRRITLLSAHTTNNHHQTPKLAYLSPLAHQQLGPRVLHTQHRKQQQGRRNNAERGQPLPRVSVAFAGQHRVLVMMVKVIQQEIRPRVRQGNCHGRRDTGIGVGDVGVGFVRIKFEFGFGFGIGVVGGVKGVITQQLIHINSRNRKHQLRLKERKKKRGQRKFAVPHHRLRSQSTQQRQG
jgi:hypothetical protein